LVAYSWRNPVVGYCQGMNLLVACLLLIMEEKEAFWTFAAVTKTRVLWESLWLERNYVMGELHYSELALCPLGRKDLLWWVLLLRNRRSAQS